jgi:hypothetical protein
MGVGRFFFWLAGASSQIVKQCSESEKIKIQGLGALLIIPTVLAFISMTYAVSTVLPDWAAYVGVIWAIFIFIVDRFFISTHFKLPEKSTMRRRIFDFGVLLRYFFAIVLGVGISHPFVLLWFDSSINTKINELHNANVLEQNQKIINAKNSVNKELIEKEELRDCINSVISAEIGGAKDTINCGGQNYYSSGKSECGTRCQEYKLMVQKLDKEIDLLRTKASKDEEQIETLTQEASNMIVNHKSTDYLAKVKALRMLENDPESGLDVSIVKYFLVTLFTVLDLLAITLKFSMPMGEYENYRATEIAKAEKMENAKRVVIEKSALIYQNSEEQKEKMLEKQKELTSITDATHDFIKKTEEDRNKYDAVVQKLMQDISKEKDEKLREDYSNYLIKIREIFNSAFQKATHQFNDFLKNI